METFPRRPTAAYGPCQGERVVIQLFRGLDTDAQLTPVPDPQCLAVVHPSQQVPMGEKGRSLQPGISPASSASARAFPVCRPGFPGSGGRDLSGEQGGGAWGCWRLQSQR